MNEEYKPGLGELLRYVGELVERGADAHYKTMGVKYRARYTPVLRAIGAGAETVTEITAMSHLTQGAISQTLGLMEADGLIARRGLDDGRKSGLRLTAQGQRLARVLEKHWEATFAAIGELETEIDHPLCRVLEDAARALEREGFSERLAAAKKRNGKKERCDVR